jgi:hypothetical protein
VNLLPKRLSISIGGHFGTSYSVCLEGRAVTYECTKSVESFPPKWDSQSEQIQPTEQRWQAFRAALDRIDVWRWQADYPNSAMVCDGTSWSVEIIYSDHQVVSAGSNCFPGQSGQAISIVDRHSDKTFGRFCRAVSKLVGREFR